ncbi:excisionase family DNA-binding protein [Nostocoides vanveenii]|uniref:Helix-turn-helix domain-containing protein n=1 Tax=Nostocoides vanveenii TaxID=330835 RepID=A0ABN2L3W5_9MICO
MALDIRTFKLPKGYDPNRHAAQLPAVLAKEYGAGWRIMSTDLEKMEVTAVREAAVAEIADDDQPAASAAGAKQLAKLVTLPAGTKMSDGDKLAALYQAQHPGFFMVQFNPHLLQARLATMTEDEVIARGKLAAALKVKPWDVLLRSRPDGGFEARLPKYTPSEHDAKLAEAAVLIGRTGWYITVNPKTLVAQVIPADPPTFPRSFALNMSALIASDRFSRCRRCCRAASSTVSPMSCPGSRPSKRRRRRLLLSLRRLLRATTCSDAIAPSGQGQDRSGWFRFWCLARILCVMTTRLLSTGQAATVMGVSRQHVVDLCRAERLPYVMVGSHRRIPSDAIPHVLSDADNLSYRLHLVVAGKLVQNPLAVLDMARQNVEHGLPLHREHSRAAGHLREWLGIIDAGVDATLSALLDRSQRARDLRSTSPFAGVLTERERQDVLNGLHK